MGLPNQALLDSTNNSAASAAAVSAPTANAVIATLGTLAAGVYRVMGVVVNVGTQETSTANLVNFQLLNGSTTVNQYPCISQPYNFTVERVTMSGSNTLRMVAKNNAISGSVYVASLIATRIG